MSENNILNDITKFGNNALSAANTLQRQVRAWVTEQVEYLIKSMDLVTEEEFNEKVDALEARIAKLEATCSGAKPAPAKKAAAAVKKPVVKKAAVKKPVAKKSVAKKPAAKAAPKKTK